MVTSDEQALLNVLMPWYRSNFKELAVVWDRVYTAQGKFHSLVYSIECRSTAQLKLKVQYITNVEMKAQKQAI